jgi:hypothetical protein
MPNELKRPKPILELEISEGEVRKFCLSRDVDAYADAVEGLLEEAMSSLRNNYHSDDTSIFRENCPDCQLYKLIAAAIKKESNNA